MVYDTAVRNHETRRLPQLLPLVCTRFGLSVYQHCQSATATRRASLGRRYYCKYTRIARGLYSRETTDKNYDIEVGLSFTREELIHIPARDMQCAILEDTTAERMKGVWVHTW